jgi:hypothetical protein
VYRLEVQQLIVESAPAEPIKAIAKVIGRVKLADWYNSEPKFLRANSARHHERPGRKFTPGLMMRRAAGQRFLVKRTVKLLIRHRNA